MRIRGGLSKLGLANLLILGGNSLDRPFTNVIPLLAKYGGGGGGGGPTTKKIMPPGKTLDVLCLFCSFLFFFKTP